MAEDFGALVAAQKETSRLLMTAEERAAADQSITTANFERSESARRGWETRQQNIALAEQEATTNQNQALYHAQENSEDTSNEGEKQTSILSAFVKLFSKDIDKSGAAAEEDETKGEARDNKMMSYLEKTAGFLGDITRQGTQKIKSGLGGLSKFLIGGLAVAALAFLNSPKFEEIKERLLNVIIPAIAKFYDNVLVPVGEALAKLFGDLMLLLEGKKGLLDVIMDNKLAIAGVVIALNLSTAWGLVLVSVGLLGKAVLAFGVLTKNTYLGFLKANIAMGKGGVLGHLRALGSTILKFARVGALIASLFVGLYNGILDGYNEFKATGSMWEATKTALVSFLANAIGFIPKLITDAISWILNKVGESFDIQIFKDAAKFMDDFNPVKEIKDGLTSMGDAISGIFDTIVNKIQNIIRSISIPGLFDGDNLADTLFGTTEEQEAAKKAKAEEQKLFEENRKALREQQKLEKEAAEAKKVEKLKAEQNAMQPKPVTAPALTPMSTLQSQGANIVNAPTSVVNANSSSNTTTSTPVRQPNMVIGMLAAST